jgi:hypothetical protein
MWWLRAASATLSGSTPDCGESLNRQLGRSLHHMVFVDGAATGLSIMVDSLNPAWVSHR